ncbi:MAG: hypothetical protein LBR77_06560 [Lachnospiraceae bacterium]|jgi:hypothetical protein|nr:hypothetical protein [Lachnospiraceae bacterium]
MFRLWGKIITDNKLQKDMVVEMPDPDMGRTQKVLSALGRICHSFDLASPLWLDANVRGFQRLSRTRFTGDNFIESIPFDFLEIQVIEE